jgi:DNA-binding response OmpR family regulator
VTILIVDDEAKLRRLVAGYLQREGYAVLEASTGARALELIATAHPGLIVLDLGLPDLPGEELTRLVRKSSDVPIVMLSAKAAENDRVMGLRLGADDYLVKPFSPRELVAHVEAVLRRTLGSSGSGAETAQPGRYGGGVLTIDTLGASRSREAARRPPSRA